MCLATESPDPAAAVLAAARVQHRREVPLGLGLAARPHRDVGARLDPPDRPVQRRGLGHVLQQQDPPRAWDDFQVPVDVAEAQRGR